MLNPCYSRGYTGWTVESMIDKSFSCRREENEDTTRRMKQSACVDNLLDWFEDNKIIWVTILAVLAAIEVMVTVIAAYILQKVKKIQKMR